ncbi:uncharacterized protein LOC123205449 [Mangifera indica]|uniref:uncharacterized protein LOC123205449 n=1 Tax=Mangifera indica TaxID=29780 RepID=UPI001CF9FBAA|nr:uncharacterized protein LOC123205449 [Mangifera indica]
MEMSLQSPCQGLAKLLITSTNFQSKACLLLSSSVPFHSSKTSSFLRIKSSKKHVNLRVVHASESETTLTDFVAERWLLEPVGDGDSRHLGYKAPMPDAFVISSSEVTVGRLPEKADMVIPVATVSGLHARVEKKEGSLLVTDLDSTNGTFIDEKRLKPGVAAAASSGTCITFGDTHLAKFRVSKLENLEESDGTSESSSVTTETS